MPQSDQGTVLVLDGQFMSSLAIARSLGRHGVRVILASSEPSPLASHSRYVHRCHSYTDPSVASDTFLDDIANLIQQYSPDLVIPVTEKTLIPIAEQRQRFYGLAAIALPPEEGLKIVLDKQATADLAASLGVPTPRSIVAGDQATLEFAAEQVGFPLVIKPINSVSRQAGSIGPQLAVTYAFDIDELLRVTRPLLEHGEVVVQEYFRGQGVGVELIAENGQLRYAFQHRRLHEMPLSGGGSCLRESVDIEPQLLDAATKMVSALNWQGVAMVEFKFDPESGAFRLIEINGRFWGSLPLSVAAGADFPLLAWQLYTGRAMTLLPPARPGVRCRDLAKDLYWHEYVLRRVTDPRLFSYPGKGTLAKGLLSVLSPQHHFDSWNLRDMRPGVVELGRLARHYYSRISALRSHHATLRTQRKAWRDGEISRKLSTANNVLILCYGNINRSAAAHAYLLQQRSEQISAELVSAGFHRHEGRPADPSMVSISAQNEVDMGPCRSRTLTQEMLDRADIVFVMEVAHLERLVAYSPAVATRSYLWGAALEDNGENIEIEDPYGKPIEAYSHCFDRLKRAADKMFVGV